MSETQSQQKESNSIQYDTKTLFGKARIVLIEHAGQVYRLMITRQGKLILNK